MEDCIEVVELAVLDLEAVFVVGLDDSNLEGIDD